MDALQQLPLRSTQNPDAPATMLGNHHNLTEENLCTLKLTTYHTNQDTSQKKEQSSVLKIYIKKKKTLKLSFVVSTFS